MSDKDRPIPQAFFACSEAGCAEDTTYPAEMLYWYEPERRWVCENCWENLPPPNPDDDDGPLHPPRGESLEAYLTRTRPPLATLLDGRKGQP